jgi:hypothetical protein
MQNPASLTTPVPRPESADSEDGWSALFPPGTRVLALPSWRRVRVVIPADTFLHRWRGSGYLPAFRPGARVYRLLQRARAASGLGTVRFTAASPTACLPDLVEDLLPGATVGAVMIGMPGADRKVVARLLDCRGQVVGYLKCAASVVARRTLRHEYRLLRLLPPGAGPVPQGYATRGSVDALLIAPVNGKMLRATLPPPSGLSDFARSLTTVAEIEMENHPWVRAASHWRGPEVESSFAILSERTWPVVIQHNDLAPWNAFRTQDGRLTAVDWEYGRTAGFPGLDLAQYLLQVACLCHRWSPRDAREYAIRCLTGDRWLRLSVPEARAMVTLAARNVHELASASGHSPGDPTQRWRQAVWQVTE